MSDPIEAVIFLDGSLADLQRLGEALEANDVACEILKPEGAKPGGG